MAYSNKLRREVMQEYLIGGEPIAEIARRRKIRQDTVYLWARREDWQGLRESIETRALEKCVEDASTKLSKHNEKFIKVWDAFLARVIQGINVEDRKGIEPETLEALARIAEKAQKGQRIAMNADMPSENDGAEIKVTYTPLREHLEEAPK